MARKSKKTQTEVLNYRVIIEKERYDNGTPVYVTYVPTLGISDYGKTIETALKNTEKLIRFHVESLVEEGEPIPSPDDPNHIFVTTSKVTVRPKKKLIFA